MSVKAAQSPADALWEPAWTSGRGEATIAERSKGDEGAAVTLYCSWFCPYAQRAWIALEEKQIPYHYTEINPYEVDPRETGGYTKRQLPIAEKQRLHPGFVENSPKGLVPAIAHNGRGVWESLQVVEYLDEAFGGPSVMPADALDRALVRIWVAHCDTRIQKHFYTMLIDQDPARQRAARDKMLQGCRELAEAMAPEKYFLGDEFSALDIALAPFWQRYLWIGAHYRGLEFPDEPAFERLGRWWQAVSARPSVARTLVCRARLVASYSQYSRNVATSDYAKSLADSISTTGAPHPPAPDRAKPMLLLAALVLGACVGLAALRRHM